MDFEHFKANFLELSIGFVLGNLLWFTRQWLWQQWVKKSHWKIVEENRKEEVLTRSEIKKLQEQLGHLSIGMLNQIELDPKDRAELEAIINEKEIIG